MAGNEFVADNAHQANEHEAGCDVPEGGGGMEPRVRERADFARHTAARAQRANAAKLPAEEARRSAHVGGVPMVRMGDGALRYEQRNGEKGRSILERGRRTARSAVRLGPAMVASVMTAPSRRHHAGRAHRYRRAIPCHRQGFVAAAP